MIRKLTTGGRCDKIPLDTGGKNVPKTMAALENKYTKSLRSDINEFYLFHGTSPEGVRAHLSPSRELSCLRWRRFGSLSILFAVLRKRIEGRRMWMMV